MACLEVVAKKLQKTSHCTYIGNVWMQVRLTFISFHACVNDADVVVDMQTSSSKMFFLWCLCWGHWFQCELCWWLILCFVPRPAKLHKPKSTTTFTTKIYTFYDYDIRCWMFYDYKVILILPVFCLHVLITYAPVW